MPFELAKYLARVGLRSASAVPDMFANLETLSKIMSAHMRTISFENMDVVLRGEISMSPDAVFDKLVTKGETKRGAKYEAGREERIARRSSLPPF